MSLGLRRLSVSYGGQLAVAGIDLEVGDGRWLALIGPNGAGKSSVLRAVAGLVEFAGEVLVDGAAPDYRRRRQLARLVALVPQRPQLPPSLSVGEYVLLGRTAHVPLLGNESRHDHAVAAEAIARLDLEALAGRALGSLSGGEAQRAVLARAVAQQAPLLLLDEPTSSLDLGHQQQVLELVDELRCERRLTVLAAMHDLTLAGQYADELALLASGRVAAAGSAEQVLRRELLERHYGASVTVLPGADGPLVVPLRRSYGLLGAGSGAAAARAAISSAARGLPSPVQASQPGPAE